MPCMKKKKYKIVSLQEISANRNKRFTTGEANAAKRVLRKNKLKTKY